MGEVVGVWVAVTVLLGAAIASGWGLFTLAPLSGGWLGCSMVFCAICGMVAHSLPLMFMDAGPDWPVTIAVPVMVVFYGLTLASLGVLIWRGLGVHVVVS